jgi:hypothetical protein
VAWEMRPSPTFETLSLSDAIRYGIDVNANGATTRSLRPWRPYIYQGSRFPEYIKAGDYPQEYESPRSETELRARRTERLAKGATNGVGEVKKSGSPPIKVFSQGIPGRTIYNH